MAEQPMGGSEPLDRPRSPMHAPPVQFPVMMSVACVVLAGCGGGAMESPVPSTVVVAPAPAPQGPRASAAPQFAEAWPDLYEAIRSGHADSLVDPRHGLVVLDNPGASIAVMTFPTFRDATGDRSAPPRLDDCDLRVGDRPEYSCDTDSYSVQGCVLTAPSHPNLVEPYKTFLSGEPELAESERAMLDKLQRTEALATVTVTDTTRDVRWHFGLVDGSWRLLVLDVVSPCSA